MYHDESLFLRQCNLILAHSKPSLVFSRQLQCSHAPTQHATLVLFAAKNTHQQALWESKPAFGWHALHICSEIYLPKQSEEDCFANHSTTSAIMTDSASATCPLNSQYQEADPFTLHFQQKHTPSLSIGTCWRHGRCFLSPWLSWTRQKDEPGKTNSVKIYLLQNTSWWVGPNLATDFSQADVVLVCLCQDVPSQSEKLEMVGPSMKKFNSTDGALK